MDNKMKKVDECTCGHCHDEREGLHVDDGLSCGCGNCHEKIKVKSSKSIVSKYSAEIIKILISTVFIVLGFVIKTKSFPIIFFCVSALVCGIELLLDCFKNIFKGKVFNEQTLMIVASIVAFVLGESFEGAFIILLYTIGEFLEHVATDNSRKKIAGLSELQTAVVHLVTKDGVKDVSPEEVTIGSILEIKKGERIPIDGVIFKGNAEVDTKAITGESNYAYLKRGEKVYSGAINVGNPIIIRTTKLYKDSTVSRIIDMVEGATAKKAKSQKFITSFAKIYTPIIAILTVLISTIPPLFDEMNFIKWIYKGLSFLVTSCPCALVISVPLAYFIGIGSMAKRGVLIKGSSYMETLSKVNVSIFDKTGTITTGDFKVTKIKIFDSYNKKEVLDYLYAIEEKSTHPISKAIVKSLPKLSLIANNVNEMSGLGIYGEINGKKIFVGNHKLMRQKKVKISENIEGAVIYIAIDLVCVGYVVLEDLIKPNAKSTMETLKRLGVKKNFIVSGDKKEIADRVGKIVGVNKVYSELLPQEKVNIVNKFKEEKNASIMFVGDGINDSPSLAIADVGIAMGGLGSEIAIESADVVIMDDDINKVALAMKAAKKIRKTIVQNIFGSLFIKFTIMVLSLVISLPIWLAMFADVGCMLLAVVNSLKNSKMIL